MNRAVQAVVIENGAETILRDGLAYDRCEVGIVTDLEGKYTITLKTDEAVTLQISSIGFQPLEIKSSKLGAFSDLSLPELQ